MKKLLLTIVPFLWAFCAGAQTEWTQLFPGTTKDLNGVDFCNETTGMVVGEKNWQLKQPMVV